MKTPDAVHPLPQRGEGVKSNRRQPRQGRQNIRAGGDHQGFFRPCRGSDVRRPSPTAHAVGYYLPPLRGCEQQRLLLSPRLTPWATSSAAPRLRATSASPPHGLRRGLLISPPLRGCEQQRLRLSPRLTPWARSSAAPRLRRRQPPSPTAYAVGYSSAAPRLRATAASPLHHGSRRGLLSSAAPRLRATTASPPPTAYAVGYYLPPLRGWEQQRLLLPPRLTPWAIILRRSAA